MKIEAAGMEKKLVADKKIVYGRTHKYCAAATVSPDEKLWKLVRRAVKNVSVPADLEVKLWNSLREKVINKG